jgi:hypothetical protein
MGATLSCAFSPTALILKARYKQIGITIIPMKAYSRSLLNQKRYISDIKMKTTASSLDSMARKRQAATGKRLLTDLNRRRIHKASIPKKKHSASPIDGIAYTTCELSG